jgi:menaquinone-dependent protoporphyrinogen oxidase
MMSKAVLIAYATKYGATAEIAEKIGEVLRKQGVSVEVLRADRVTDVTSYAAVVLGSAVYMGKWRNEAAKLLERNEQQLARLPVWLFSSGPTGDGEPSALLQGWRFPQEQQATADRIKPRDSALFHGKLDRQNLNILEKFAIKTVGSPVGDFRDWQMISKWAGTIANAIKALPRQ